MKEVACICLHESRSKRLILCL